MEKQELKLNRDLTLQLPTHKPLHRNVEGKTSDPGEISLFRFENETIEFLFYFVFSQYDKSSRREK